MSTQVTRLRLVWVCLSLLLLIAPMQQVWGQEELPDDDHVEVEATVEGEPTPGEAEEEIVVMDEAVLTQRVFLPVVQQSGDAGLVSEGQDEESAEVNAAFTQNWFALPCRNVELGEFGLWDDIPGTTSDAGLFWLFQNNAGNETCTYFTLVPGGVLTANFRHLRLRVAVGDGARFIIRVYRFAGATCNTDGANLLRQYQTPATADHNRFIIYNITLPPGYTVCRVGISLTDDPDSSAATRTSALIDYIQIWNEDTRAVAWQETFANQH